MVAYTITATCAGETATAVVDVPRLPTPQGLVVDTITADPPTDSSFSVKWDAVPGATGYTATATSSGQPDWPGTVDASGDPVKASFSSLSPSTTYTVTVIAQGDGTILDSAPATITVSTTAPAQAATVTVSADGRIEAMVHAGPTAYDLTLNMPSGTPSPPVTLNVSGPDGFTFDGTGDAGEVIPVTAPADGEYVVTDPRTGDTFTTTIPHAYAEGGQMGGVRVGYWLRAESDAASEFDVGYHAEGLDPAADPTDGSLTPGEAMQWRGLDGQTYTLHLTNPAGTDTTRSVASGDAAQQVDIGYTPAGK